jgi:hypothetical protein
MRFDPERAAFVCDWIETYCRLYEGDKAGEPLILLPASNGTSSPGCSAGSGGPTSGVSGFGGSPTPPFWAAKKNGKSPAAAAYNLYLLAATASPGRRST